MTIFRCTVLANDLFRKDAAQSGKSRHYRQITRPSSIGPHLPERCSYTRPASETGPDAPIRSGFAEGSMSGVPPDDDAHSYDDRLPSQSAMYQPPGDSLSPGTRRRMVRAERTAGDTTAARTVCAPCLNLSWLCPHSRDNIDDPFIVKVTAPCATILRSRKTHLKDNASLLSIILKEGFMPYFLF